MKKIYEFRMTGWDGDSNVKMTNDIEYSKEEYKDLCANLYIEESLKKIKKFKENNNWDNDNLIEDRLDYYKQVGSLYDDVCNRLLNDYGFKDIEIYSSFIVDNNERIDIEVSDDMYDVDIIRKKYKNKIRENKLKKLI